MDIMTGFPPPEDKRATLANWRSQPYSSWAFHHVREIVPSADIPHDPAISETLPTGPALVDPDSLAADLEPTRADALVVLRNGAVAHEIYRHGMTAHDPHILFSVSKSMLGLLAGCLADKGLIDPDAPLTDHIPELATTAYAGATICQALDMRVGVLFDEDYFATSGPIVTYREAANWNPPTPGMDADLRSFQLMLTETDGAHEGRFHYVSPVTDLLAWVFERATGTRYADLMSHHLWRPLGAEAPAYITVDRIGGARAAGGMCTTARDLARVGAMLLNGGRAGDRQVVPEAWIRDIFSGGDAEAWATGDFAEKFAEFDMTYRSKWYIHGRGDLIHGLGIHGQYLFVDPARDLVIAWMSSEHDPVSEGAFPRVMAVVNRIRDAVAL